MGGIQMLLTIGAIVLLALLVMNVNRTIITHQDIELQSEAITTAITVGQSLMNEITSKTFDEGVRMHPVMDFRYMTAVDSLGPEYGENRSTFDDVDDYNRFSLNDSTPRMGVFTAKADVKYMQDDNFSLLSNVKSRTKLVKVIVYNSVIKDTLKFYSYKCY